MIDSVREVGPDLGAAVYDVIAGIPQHDIRVALASFDSATTDALLATGALVASGVPIETAVASVLETPDLEFLDRSYVVELFCKTVLPWAELWLTRKDELTSGEVPVLPTQ